MPRSCSSSSPSSPFLLAIVASLWMGAIMGIGAEAYSRACTNLALIAIAIVMVFEEEGSAG